MTIKIDIWKNPVLLAKELRGLASYVLEVPDRTSSADLRVLYKRHIKSKYGSRLLISDIAEHKNTPARILGSIYEKFSRDEMMLNSLACNPNIKGTVLNKLRKSGFKSVKKHLSNR